MIVQRFVKWCEIANLQERSAGVKILAEGLVENWIPDAERPAAIAALTSTLDDPSPKVRLVLAEALAMSPNAPRQIVIGLCQDIEAIACLVARASPVLTDADLVDLFASGGIRLQAVIAGRPSVSVRVAAAIAEVGGPAAAASLVANSNAQISAASFRRIAERHPDDIALRAALVARADIPGDVRQTLLLQVAQTLALSPLVQAVLGGQRAQRLVSEASERATATLADAAPCEDIPALVEHLRSSGQLSTAFLIRMVCSGNIDVFAAALVSLSGLSDRRVRAIVVDGHESAFAALIGSCGLPTAATPLLRTAVKVWKQAATNGREADFDEVPSRVITRLAELSRAHQGKPGYDGVLALVGRLETETARDRARHVVQRLAAA